MTSCRHWIYYLCVSARKIKKKQKELTLNHYVLTILFFWMTLATDLVGKAIALMSEGLTTLECQDLLHQLTLDMEDQ